LEIVNHPIGTVEAIAIVKLIHSSKSLEKLSVIDCNIDSEGACHLAQNTTLRDLNLSHNPFGREGAISLAGILHTNISLQILALSDCTPPGEKGTHKLLNAMTINSTVQHLILPKECEEKFPKLSEVQSRVFS